MPRHLPAQHQFAVAAAGDDAPDGFVMPDLTGLPVVSAQLQLTSRHPVRSAEICRCPGRAIGKGDAAPSLPIKPAP